MARNYLLNFNDGELFLTSDGTETGRVCKNEITNAELLRYGVAGNSNKAANGETYNEFPLNAGAGFDFAIKVPVIGAAVYSQIVALITESETADAPALTIEAAAPGVIGFSVSARGFYNPVPAAFERFSGTKYINAVFNFSTVAS